MTQDDDQRLDERGDLPRDPASTPPTGLDRAVIAAARVPFTIAGALVLAGVGLAFGSTWRDLERFPWFAEVAFGLGALEAGRWLTLLTGPLFALSPGLFLVGLASFVVFVGFAEWRLGTLRTVLVAVGFQAITMAVTFGFLAVARGLPWEWAQALARESDVGFSAGVLAALAVASATVPSPWRLRLQLALLTWVTLWLALVGQLADLEHFVAVALALPVAGRLAGDRAVPVTVRPSRAELRRIATAGLLIVGAASATAHVIPDRLTPFGPAQHTQWTWLTVAISLVAWAVVARGLLTGRAWAWWLAVLVAAAQVVLGALLLLVPVVAPGDASLVADTIGLPQLVAGSVLHLGFLAVLVVARPAYRPLAAAEPLAGAGAAPDRARTLLHAHGGSSISWMTTWTGMRHMTTTDGEGFVGFREHAGVAIALGDPVGPEGAMGATFDEFVRRCEASDLVPFLFSCTRAGADVAASRGWRTVQIAEDNLIDLPDLEFKGSKWQAVRTALNKAGKEGIEFRLGALEDEPPEILAQVKAVSEAWLGEKALPEMGFTLGGVPEALDREVRTGLAVDAEGRVHGVTSWLPAYRAGATVEGWTLDVMRRMEFEGSFRPTMEFLIASSALAFKEQGASYVSLSGAPLARSTPADQDGPVERVLDAIGAAMEPLYGFRSLHRFKAKFQPRLDPMFMAYRDEGDLPQVGIAITRAFLPDAGVLDMAAVVKTAVAGNLRSG